MSVTFDRPPLHEQVLTHMTRLITQGTWASGGALPSEAELAHQYRVSRTVIRECVRVLASRGVLDVRQGRVICVAPYERWNTTEPLALLVKSDYDAVFHWLEVRALLERDSAELAARRATPWDHAHLAAIMHGLRASDDAPDAYREGDIAFHLTIARATGNPALVRLLEGVIQPLHEQLQERALTPLTRHASTREHEEILACIVARDAPGARAAMAAHLTRVVDETRQLLREEGRVSSNE